MQRTSSKVFLEDKGIRSIAVMVTVEITVTRAISDTGLQQRASSEIPLEGKCVSSVLILILIEVSLTFTGIPATIALGRKSIFLYHTAISVFPACAIAHAWFSNGTGSTGTRMWAIGNIGTIVIT